MTDKDYYRLQRIFAVMAVCAILAVPVAVPAQSATYRFEIQPQDLGSALRAFSHTSKQQIVFDEAMVRGKRSPALIGDLSVEDALSQLLAGTGLRADRSGTGVIVIARASTTVSDASDPTAHIAQAAPISDAADMKAADEGKRVLTGETDGTARGIPEILVQGSRVLNTDIRRSEDDVQPYIIFDAADIRNSQAGTIEEFLGTRLPMNASRGALSQQPNEGSSRSQFDLRGLGVNQTLILVDGRRMPGTRGTTNTGELIFNQPDLNGIPLAAVERIEVLPATASGIYGGGATGGVINVVMKRDYSGVEMRASYGNTFASDAAYRKLEATAGFNLEGGRTNVLLSASYSDANALLSRERDFVRRARALLLRNEPALFFDQMFFVPAGATGNIYNSAGTFNADFTAFTPAPLELKTGTVLSSGITFVPPGYAGPQSDGGEALAANAGQFNLDLPSDTNGLNRTLIAAPTVNSAGVNLRRAFTDRIDAFLDLSRMQSRSRTYGDINSAFGGDLIYLPSAATDNPFTTDVFVTVPKTAIGFPHVVEDTALRGSGGVVMRLGRGWTSGADYVWSRVRTRDSSTSPAINFAGLLALGDGTLNILRDVNAFPLDYTPYLLPSPNRIDGPIDTLLQDANLRLSGPLLRLPAGPLTLSAIAAHRREEAKDAVLTQVDLFTGDPGGILFPARSQSVDSVAFEIRAPLIADKGRALEFQASVRRDAYETRSVRSGAIVLPATAPVEYTSNEVSATKFMAGVRFAPVPDIALRASYNTGFLPPSIGQIVSRTVVASVLSPFPDPKRGGTLFTGDSTGSYTLMLGGNPDLKPEESESVSAGVVITPQVLPDFRLSIDYTRIDKTGEIATLLEPTIVAFEDELPGRVTRAANLPGDLPGWAGPITGIDTRLANISTTRVATYDVQARYRLRTQRAGEFEFLLAAVRMDEFERRTVAGAAAVDSAGFDDGPLEWRGNMGLNWRLGPWTAGWNAQYYDSYWVYPSTVSASVRDVQVRSQGSAAVPSQIYHDVYARLRLDGIQTSSLLADVELMAGLQNVFNKSPPILATPGLSGGYSTYGDPRLRRYTVSIQKHF